MLYVLSHVNNLPISLLTAHNIGRTSNFHELGGPHECLYDIQYCLPIEGFEPTGHIIVKYQDIVFYEKLKFQLTHDRLDGHTKLIEKAMRIVGEKLEADEYE